MTSAAKSPGCGTASSPSCAGTCGSRRAPSSPGAGQARHSFALADGALALVRARADATQTDVTFEELGLTGLLLTVPETRLDAFVARTRGPLLDVPDLLATLDAWYASGGSRAQVADTVSIHRNSVGHRIDRIRALLGTDPDDATAARDLRAALAAREALRAGRSTPH